MKIYILGIDLAKRVFQLHGADRSGHTLHRSKVMRDGFVEAVRSLHHASWRWRRAARPITGPGAFRGWDAKSG